MVTCKITINNTLGLHARPIALLKKALKDYKNTKVTVKKANKSANAQNAYEMMFLDVLCGEEVEIIAEGPHEKEALELTVKIFSENF